MRVDLCRSCRAQIVWLKTTTGKNMPTDAASVAEDDAVFDHTRHKSHFATCPNAPQHRRRAPTTTKPRPGESHD